MSEGRGSAAMNMVTMISLLCLLFLAKSTNAETYTVGGPKGWTFGIKKWPNGKSFVAGDVLGKFKLNFSMKASCNFECTFNYYENIFYFDFQNFALILLI